MTGLYRRYLTVLVRFLPFAVAFLRDRHRFVLFGPPRNVDETTHRRRAERMSETMVALGPAFIKAGQVLSTRPDIVPPVYAEVFQRLQDEIPEDAGGDPETVVATELGDDLDLSTLERVAGGSLAYVYTVAYRGERIALKVRRPGLHDQIERDLRVVRGFVPIASLFASERQQYSIENVADDFEAVILDELDFEREREMMVEVGANFADDPRVRIPAVYPELSSERVLAMEYVTGRKLTDEDAFAGLDLGPSEMATRIATVYLRMGLVDGVFHADPHPGNLAVTEAGELLVYDFGMSDRLAPTVQEDIVGLYRALVRRDVDALVSALVALDVLEPGVDRAKVRQVLELVIGNLAGQSDVTWRLIITELTATLREFPFRIPPNVMLLIRVGTVSEGVCRQLDPRFDFLAVIREFLHEEGLIESELGVLVDETRQDLRASLPALAHLPARLDRVLGHLERGDLVVGTDPVEGGRRSDSTLGAAVLAGAALVAAAILGVEGHAGAPLVTALGAVFLVVYLVGAVRG